MIHIFNIYGSIMCIYHKLITFNIFGINCQHSMLDFHTENTVLQQQKYKGILPTFMLAYMEILTVLPLIYIYMI